MTSPWAYNPSLFPLGLYTNGSGGYATPYDYAYGSGAGWNNALMPDPSTGKIGQLPAWAGAANPLAATQQWAQGANQNMYGTQDPQTLGVLGGFGFPLMSDPRMQQDFAARTFNMTPQAWMQGTYGTPQQGGGGTG